jgi:hypothetical protein
MWPVVIALVSPDISQVKMADVTKNWDDIGHLGEMRRCLSDQGQKKFSPQSR